ncbi:MAG: lysophospholipid acyltransferase family protein [Aeromicrobium sp.]
MSNVALPLTPAHRGLGEGGLGLLRSVMGRYIRSHWEIAERGEWHVPDTGPVIIASNHIGWLDGPLLIATTPRPAHALVKQESFVGKTGLLLRMAGQISVDRRATDAGALRKAIQALRAGQAVVVYPEGTRGDGEFTTIKGGVGYLALVTGAPVVPVAIFGTRKSGEASGAKPEKGAHIDVIYGPPIQFMNHSWPREKESVAEATEEIHQHLLAHLAEARKKTKLELPGKLPVGDTDD